MQEGKSDWRVREAKKLKPLTNGKHILILKKAGCFSAAYDASLYRFSQQGKVQQK